MGQEASSLYYSPSTTPGGYPFYFTHGTRPFSQPVTLPSSSTSSTESMAPRNINIVAPADGNTTIAGPEYRQGSESEGSNARSIPPPSNFKIYYATSEVENRDFDGWENKLCFPLPITDVGTCCAAGWIPCYLFGKSNWRLEQLRERKDPSNKTYKNGQGCNIWCWAWAGLQVFHCGWVGTGFQRNRVRATYGIKGTCFNDFLTAYFCNCCVLMQTDREIQAREGRSSFITNKKYDPNEKLKQEASASQQPISMQQMRYQPGGDIGAYSSNSNGALSPQESNVDPKKSTPFPKQGAVPSHRDSKVGSAYRNARSEPAHRKTSDFAWSDFSLFPKNKSPITQSIHSPTDLSQSRSGLWSPNKNQGSLEDLEAATTHEDPDKSNQQGPLPQALGTNKEEQHHHTDSEQEAPRRSYDSTVKNWRHNSGKRSPKRSKVLSMAGASTKMSYVHDFTDCPINKSVLDYYDRQQKIIDENQQQKTKIDVSLGKASATTSPFTTTPHILNNSTKAVSGISRENNSEETTANAEIGERENTSTPTKPTSKTFDSHILEDCPKANDRVKTSKPRKPVEHSVDQCPRHLDGTSSDIGERHQTLKVDHGELAIVYSFPQEEQLVRLSSSEKDKGTYNNEVPKKSKKSEENSINGSSLATTVIDGTEESNEKIFKNISEKANTSHFVDESLILSHKESQRDIGSQRDLRHALSKAFPDKVDKNGGASTSESLHRSQEPQLESGLEHALGETRVNSVVTQEELYTVSLPSEMKLHEKNGKSV